MLRSTYVTNLASLSALVTKILKATESEENGVIGSTYGSVKVIGNNSF